MAEVLAVMTYLWVLVATIGVIAAGSNLLDSLSNRTASRDGGRVGKMISTGDMRRDFVWVVAMALLLTQAVLTVKLLGPLAATGLADRVALRVAQLVCSAVVTVNLTQDARWRAAIRRESSRGS